MTDDDVEFLKPSVLKQKAIYEKDKVSGIICLSIMWRVADFKHSE